jgi:hypothetical protein
MRSAIRVAAALAVAATFCSTAASASARVVRTFGTTGPDRLRFPGPMAFGPDGLLHVVDRGDAARDPVFVRVYTPAGAQVGGFRVAVGKEGGLWPVAADAAGNTYVGIAGAVLKYSLGGALLARLPVPPPDGPPSAPVGVGVDAAGRIVTLDPQDSRFDTFDSAGRLVASFRRPSTGNGFDRRIGISLSSSGTIYAYDRTGISVLDASGAVVRRLARPSAIGLLSTLVDGPGGTAYTVTGPRVHKLGPAGEYLGAVGTERIAGEPMAAVGPDGSIYITSVHALRRVPDGAVLKLAPIATVDVTPPSIVVDSFTSPPLPARVGPRTKMVLGRMVLTLSETAEYRVSVKRRATTRDPRNREFGRYLHLATIDVPAVAAGPHRLVLDWLSFGSRGRGPSSGRYQLAFVARDESGNESPPARVTFSVTRRRR